MLREKKNKKSFISNFCLLVTRCRFEKRVKQTSLRFSIVQKGGEGSWSKGFQIFKLTRLTY